MLETCGYNDLMVQAYASRNPRIAFTHIHPGAVDTGVYHFQNPVLNFVVRGLGWPVLRMVTTRPQDCAEWMVYSLLEGARAAKPQGEGGEEGGETRGSANGGEGGSSMFRRGPHGDDIGMENFPAASDEEKEEFWNHCVNACQGAWVEATAT